MSAKFNQFNLKCRANDQTPGERYVGSEFDRLISGFLLLLCLPIIVLNTLLALIQKKPVFVIQQQEDCLGRVVEFSYFRFGVMKGLGVLGAVFSKRISFCGMPLNIELTANQQTILHRYQHIPPGLLDAINVHQSIGLSTEDKIALLEKQLMRHESTIYYSYSRGG